MKRGLLLSGFLGGATAVSAQLIVNDPANTAVNAAIQSAQTANHLEVLRQWAAQLEALNRQIRHLEEQLGEQRRLRAAIGDPLAAGSQVTLQRLAPPDLARTYGDTLRVVRQLADATASLRRTAEGVYAELDDRTALRQPFTRQTSGYRRYAAIERQADQAARVIDETSVRQADLQADLAETLVTLKAAPTQAEVEKITAKITALNGQLALLEAQRRDEADKLQSQQIQNENQAAKERQDLLEKQVTEERQSLKVINAWQRGIQIAPGKYSRP